MEFEWKGRIKVVVGEFTRAGQFDYFAAVGALDTDQPEADYRLATNQLLIQYVPTRVYVCEEGNWRLLTSVETIEEGGNTFQLAPVITEDLWQQLPAGLAKRWVFAADREQGYLSQSAADFFDKPLKSDGANSGG